MQKFSVVMSVYNGDTPEKFKCALDSLLSQTSAPSEIIITVDGPVDKILEKAVKKYGHNHIIKTIWLEKNLGLANSRNVAIKNASFELVAVMDADDISSPYRFEKQLLAFENSDADVIGGLIEEFTSEIGDLKRIRTVPSGISKIISFSKWRSPVNHVTLMFKRKSFNAVGGYAPTRFSEDWDLIIKMLSKDMLVENIPEILVFVRSGENMVDRRRQIPHILAELNLLREMKRIGYTTTLQFIMSASIRITVRILPRWVASLVYSRVLRKLKTQQI